ncbi:CocE/NonD family hydrolase [Bacillus horti]|uniref:Acyl esterase n=1 Tax=Caldalkalibacillus horti TaxID=77523 RepID=A0ABT9W0F0_9BACI|nr:CocE/NonD family hydrolase [Bacillus horti]MDQ0166732.1 putative acyl esterase [Bacillus horti]
MSDTLDQKHKLTKQTTDSLLEVMILRDVRVPMRDGLTLSTDVYRPKLSGEYPAIVVRTPYGKTSRVIHEMGTYFAARGYVVLYQDVRGRGDSDGEFIPYRSEGKDGYDCIEWAAEQDWCTGAVGTLGGSYLGRIQWLTALQKPPHLKTMISVVTPSDPFVEWPTGVPTPHHLCWLYMVGGRVMQNVDVVDWERIYSHLPLMTMDELTGKSFKHWREELSHTYLDEWWKEISYQNQFDRINLPALHISGWYDDEQVGTPLNYYGMRTQGASEHARNNQKLLMGPWTHQINTSAKIGDLDFGPDALIDLKGYQLRWFNHWLKQENNGIVDEAPVRLFVMGDNEWRDEEDWPLPQTQWTKYYIHSEGSANSRFGDGKLSTTVPSVIHTDASVAQDKNHFSSSFDTNISPSSDKGKSFDQYTYDPANPVPFITDMVSSQIGGPDDYSAIERRDDVLVYTTDVLEEDVEVTGPIKMELFASSTAKDTDFMVKLLDVWPSGYVQRLTDGMVRARFREGMAKPKLIEPNKIYSYEVDCWNTCHVFKKGHQIRIEIASSAFPKYDRNLNTGEDLAQSSTMVKAKQTIYHDSTYTSAVVLPIIPRK